MVAMHLQRVTHELPADVQLWQVNLDAYAEAVALEGLGTQEHARAARMAFPQDGRRFLASRHALRQLLAHALSRAPDDLVIEPDAFGKPHLVDGIGLHFNLSHSAHVAVIGVSFDCEIGVDVEVIHQVVDADALAATHFTDAERAEWSRAAAPLRDRTFLACWTRKEACVKALGVGLSLQPQSLDVGCTPGVRVLAIPVGERQRMVTHASLRVPIDAVAAAAIA
jgi:4'-phosphopantetheinyl transferase